MSEYTFYQETSKFQQVGNLYSPLQLGWQGGNGMFSISGSTSPCSGSYVKSLLLGMLLAPSRALFLHAFEGILSRDEYFLKVYDKKRILSVQALIVFTIFLLLSWLKNQIRSFSLLLWNYLLILKILPVTHFEDPKMAILTLKMLTGDRLWFCKIMPGAACDKVILAHFPCSQWEVSTGEHRPITDKGILMRVSVSIFCLFPHQLSLFTLSSYAHVEQGIVRWFLTVSSCK